jgi:hypothetical protein
MLFFQKLTRSKIILTALLKIFTVTLFIACPENGTDNALTKTGLESAINEANALLDSITISEDGAGLSQGARYAARSDHEAFEEEINMAENILANAKKQNEIDTAREKLLEAKAAFEAVIKTKAGPTTEMVKFNAPDAVYDGTGIVTGFGSGERYLLYPLRIDPANDSVTIEAKVKITSDSLDPAALGINGTGFVSIAGANRKGYMLLTPQNIRYAGTIGTGGSGTIQLLWNSWVNGEEYIFRSTINNGRIAHRVFNTDMQQLTVYTGITGHFSNDVFYAAIGGTSVQNMEWSQIKVTVNDEEKPINTLLPQSTFPSLSASARTARLLVNEQGSVSYNAAAAGGAPAEVTAVSDAPDIVRVDSHLDGKILFTGLKAGSAVITVTNNADPLLAEKITVTVIEVNFPESDDYGSLAGKTYPAAGADSAYTDGDLMITFDNQPSLTAGMGIYIFDRDSGETVDAVYFAGETQTALGSSNNVINVGSQLVRVIGSSVYITPHFGKLKYNRRYCVGIPSGAVTAELNGKNFAGLSNNKANAAWSFTTRAEPVLSASVPVTVNAQSQDANFRTVYGALSAIASKEGNWTINVAPGVYNDLVHYAANAANQTIVINGTGGAKYGSDVTLQYTVSNLLNSGDGETQRRPSFFFSGANLVLKNITLKNASARSPGYDPGQAEAVYFANGNVSDGTRRTFAAYNCSFLSHQDTIQTSGKNWFYKCYIEGDTDYIWGTAEVCLLEECELLSVNDPNKSSKDAVLLVARTGSTAAAVPTVGKGYVIYNSKVKTENGMTTYFGRNAGGNNTFYDQTAVIKTAFTNEGSGKIADTIWNNAGVFLDGAKEHVGRKIYGNTVNGQALDTGKLLANTTIMTPELYNAEYGSRESILNRVYNKSGAYEAAMSVWNISGLKTEFGAD